QMFARLASIDRGRLRRRSYFPKCVLPQSVRCEHSRLEREAADRGLRLTVEQVGLHRHDHFDLDCGGGLMQRGPPIELRCDGELSALGVQRDEIPAACVSFGSLDHRWAGAWPGRNEHTERVA